MGRANSKGGLSHNRLPLHLGKLGKQSVRGDECHAFAGHGVLHELDERIELYGDMSPAAGHGRLSP